MIGCGAAATDLVAAIDRLDDARLHAVHDPARERAVALAGSTGAAVHNEMADLLADPGVDAVYVGTPHHLLAPIALRALAAGRHVLAEKPAATTLAELAELDEAATRNGLALGVCFVLRGAGATRSAKRLLERGVIGDVRAVRLRAVLDKPDTYWDITWRGRLAESGGGVVLMNGIHQLDLVAHLTDRPFVTAMAQVATMTADVEVEDTAAAVLRLDGGAIVSMALAAHSSGAQGDEPIEFDGTLGRLDLDPYGAGSLRVHLRRPWGDIPAGEWVDVAFERCDGYTETLRDFGTAVRDGDPPPALAGARDAAAALATVQAIYTSAATGKISPSSPTSRCRG